MVENNEMVSIYPKVSIVYSITVVVKVKIFLISLDNFKQKINFLIGVTNNFVEVVLENKNLIEQNDVQDKD